MKKITFLLLLMFCALSYGQEASTIQGKILDGELYNEPLLMATVSINNTTLSTHTNFNGNFEFNDLTPGSYEVLVQFLGYEAIQIPVTVNAGEHEIILETLYAKTLSLPSTADVSNIGNTSIYTPNRSTYKSK